MDIPRSRIEQAREEGFTFVRGALSSEETRAFAQNCQQLWQDAPREYWLSNSADEAPDSVFSFPMRLSWLGPAMTGLRKVAQQLTQVVDDSNPVISINRQERGGIQTPHTDGPSAEGIVAVVHALHLGGFHYVDKNGAEQVQGARAGDVMLQADMQMLHRGFNPNAKPRFTAAIWHPSAVEAYLFPTSYRKQRAFLYSYQGRG
jgi:hypothetical protein